MTVAVVVATRNRAALLLRLLDALAAQRGAPPFEVVVVDDGSTDGTTERVEKVAPALPMPVRVLRQGESTGPAGARNRGWRATAAPVVAFTDDDCIPAPGWLAALVGALEADGAALAAGVTTFPADQADHRTTWSYWMEDDGRSGHYSTCNVAYRRDALEAVAGFDAEGFRHRSRRRGVSRCVNGEDTDLAWRAIEAGFAATIASGAVVHHEVFPLRWREHLRNIPRLEGLVLLMKKHPHLRARFGVEYVYRTDDAAALGVLVGAAGLAVRRLRPLAALVAVASAWWYVRVFLRFRRPPPPGRGGYAVAIPLGFVADSYAAFLMIRASIRHRTLLL
ncbi:MAG: glycosyltransferase family 2 protein [Acidimicrobiia bacterium]